MLTTSAAQPRPATAPAEDLVQVNVPRAALPWVKLLVKLIKRGYEGQLTLHYSRTLGIQKWQINQFGKAEDVDEAIRTS